MKNLLRILDLKRRNDKKTNRGILSRYKTSLRFIAVLRNKRTRSQDQLTIVQKTAPDANILILHVVEIFD